MNKWIEHILKMNAKDKKERNQVGHRNFYRVDTNYWGSRDQFDIVNAEFYVRKKEGPVEVIKDRIWTRQYEIADAKKRLEEAQRRAEKALELCGVIETDIGILEDELQEMEELLTKYYSNDPR